MTESERLARDPGQLEMIEHLRELVRAIDARTWHFEHKGETEIAREAVALRQRALDRIAELEGHGRE